MKCRWCGKKAGKKRYCSQACEWEWGASHD